MSRRCVILPTGVTRQLGAYCQMDIAMKWLLYKVVAAHREEVIVPYSLWIFVQQSSTLWCKLSDLTLSRLGCPRDRASLFPLYSAWRMKMQARVSCPSWIISRIHEWFVISSIDWLYYVPLQTSKAHLPLSKHFQRSIVFSRCLSSQSDFYPECCLQLPTRRLARVLRVSFNSICNAIELTAYLAASG